MTGQQSSTPTDAAISGSDEDRIREGANATLNGSDNSDTLNGTGSDDVLNGLGGNDNINGLGGNDSLFGGDGNDFLSGGLGDDFIDGEVGIDTVDYAGEGQGVTVNLSLGSAEDGNKNTDTLSSIENAIGSQFNDTLIGSIDANTLTGGDGGDTLEGRAGSDTLDGGAGTDTATYVNASGGISIVISGSGGDGDGFTDRLIAVENVTGSGFADTITGDSLANVIIGGAGGDTIDGGGGDDQLEGDEGDDILTGGAGNDTFVGGAGRDTIDGGAGIDTLILEKNGQSGSDAVFSTIVNLQTGLVSADGINATTAPLEQEDNTALGGVRTDFPDTIDTNVKVEGSFSGTLEDREDPETEETEPGDEDFIQIELLANTRYDFQFLRTAVTVNEVAPFAVLRATDGTFLAQSDLAGVRNEFDTQFSFTPKVSGTYIIAIRNPEDQVADYTLNVTSSSVDTITGIENVTGSDQIDSITGNAVGNVLLGLGGNDELVGLGGADTLNGGEGADNLIAGDGDDTLIGGSGRDVLDGGAGTDTADYSSQPNGLHLEIGLGAARTTAGDVDTLISIEAVVGTDFSDTLLGDNDVNTFSGGAGDDLLRGFGNADSLTGGLGADTIEGGSGDDTLDGGDGNDVLRGGDGNDVLIGGLGDDTLDGGTGHDRYEFSGLWGEDTVIAGGSFNTIVITDADAESINVAPTGDSDVRLTFNGKPNTSILLSEFVGNEDKFRVVDQDGNTLHINNSGTSTSLAIGIGVDETISAEAGNSLGLNDFYTFTAPTNGTISATVTGLAIGTTIEFLDAAGETQTSGTADATGTVALSMPVSVSTSYFVSVSDTGTGVYSLDMSFSAQTSGDSVENPTTVNIPFLLESVSFESNSNPSEVYRVVAPDDMTLVVNTSMVTGDLDVLLYDDDGNLLKESATVGSTPDGLSIEVKKDEAYIVEIVARDPTATADVQIFLQETPDTGANGSIDTASQIDIGQSVSGAAGLDPNLADYHTFTVETAGEVSIVLTNLQDDLRIDLFDSDGVRVGQAQTSNSFETLVQTISAGTYFIGIVAQTSSDASIYDLSVTFQTPDASDTLSGATTFGGLPLTVTQTVGESSDVADYYSHVPTSDGTLNVRISNLEGNIGLETFNQNGVRIASDVGVNSADKSITLAVNSGQTYFFGTSPSEAGASGTYTLDANFVADAGNALTSPTNVDPNFSRVEAIGFNLDTDDNYRVISGEAGTLTVNVTDVSAPVDLHLYAVDGTRLTASRNTGNSDEQITFDLEANTAYIIAVTPTNTSSEGFYTIDSSFSITSSAQASASVAVVDENAVGS